MLARQAAVVAAVPEAVRQTPAAAAVVEWNPFGRKRAIARQRGRRAAVVVVGSGLVSKAASAEMAELMAAVAVVVG